MARYEGNSKAYLFSGVSNLDVPQDHVFVSTLFKLAQSMEIKYILSGANNASEGIFPKSWHCSNVDSTNIKRFSRLLVNTN